MKIGIVGSEGVVGSACKFGFEKNGHEVHCHDLKIPESTIHNVMDCEVIFICVPTPSNDDGSCNTSIVENVIKEISITRKDTPYSSTLSPKVNLPKTEQIIAIKSTVPPTTTRFMEEKYGGEGLFFAMVPEFLRERCAITDFCENHDVCIVGTYHEFVFNKIKEAHGNLPQKFVRLTPIEAEFCKYFNNVYNATLITFANSFYEVCKKYGVNYTNIKNAMTNRKHIVHNYLECNKNFRGFGGVCLPKDCAALSKISEGTKVEFFSDLLKENSKYAITIPPGMRLEE